ncbi:MAG: DUF6492 family protein [Actinomycetota bacterium]|nr:DUF6492 family protein [Actinomycetota bacterium]
MRGGGTLDGATLVTPCYPPDRPRLDVLRASLAACGVDAPHVVVVADAARPAFADLERDPAVRVCTYGEVLPAELVSRLARGPRPLDRFRGRRQGGRLSRVHWGWMVQQYVKLAAGSVVETPTWLCVDSDVAFVRPPPDGAFIASSGRPIVLELIDFPLGEGAPVVLELRTAACRLLGLDPAAVDHRAISSGWIVPFHAGVVAELLAYLDDRHREPWWAAIARHGASEYETYGLFARYVHGLREVDAEDRRWCWLVYDLAGVDDEVRRAVDEEGVFAVMVDAHLADDPEPALAAIRREWARLAEAGPGPVRGGDERGGRPT